MKTARIHTEELSADLENTLSNREPKVRAHTVSGGTTVDLGAESHIGKVRENNEDAFLVIKVGRSMRTLLTNLAPSNLDDVHTEIAYAMLVADGMGGGPGGEVASRTAISALIRMGIETPDWIFEFDGENTPRVLQRIKDRFERLRTEFAETVLREPHLSGMGTTMTVALSLGADLIIGHVGDSRAYLFRRGKLVQLTKDQTMAHLLAELGVLTADQADKHPSRHMLTGAITADGKNDDIELRRLRLVDGDQLLLCSDGLTEMVSNADIEAILERRKPAAEACHTLIERALANGGKDNVTVVLAAYQITD
jgi:protein phosphatase